MIVTPKIYEVRPFQEIIEKRPDMDNVENKILYCSRTHSQITQFINELKRTEFCNKVRVVSLGSRKTLCINETLKKKSGMSTMKLNDLCLDIQKKKQEEVLHVLRQGQTCDILCNGAKRDT